MFTISVCMIIKNEEEVLDRILTCANKFADEIVIVDTGSTDKSISIAKKYTDKIFNFEWTDNFSDARNFSFSNATKDYIMWLDADDYITDEEIKRIISLKNSNGNHPSMYLFKYAMGFEENKPTFEFYRERLLKRGDNFKWSGFIHEVIPLTHDAKYLDITIEHRKIKPSDPKRNLRIYRKAKRKGVDFTPRDIYYYARELYYNAYYKSSLIQLKKFLKCKNIYPPNEIEASILISNICIYLGDTKQAKKYLFKCLENQSPNPELCYSIGNIFSIEKKYSQAIFWFKLSMTVENSIGGFHEKDYENFFPHLQLSIIYYTLGDISKAKSHHQSAKHLKPNHPSIIYNEKFFA